MAGHAWTHLGILAGVILLAGLSYAEKVNTTAASCPDQAVRECMAIARYRDVLRASLSQRELGKMCGKLEEIESCVEQMNCSALGKSVEMGEVIEFQHVCADIDAFLHHEYCIKLRLPRDYDPCETNHTCAGLKARLSCIDEEMKKCEKSTRDWYENLSVEMLSLQAEVLDDCQLIDSGAAVLAISSTTIITAFFLTYFTA